MAGFCLPSGNTEQPPNFVPFLLPSLQQGLPPSCTPARGVSLHRGSTKARIPLRARSPLLCRGDTSLRCRAPPGFWVDWGPPPLCPRDLPLGAPSRWTPALLMAPGTRRSQTRQRRPFPAPRALRHLAAGTGQPSPQLWPPRKGAIFGPWPFSRPVRSPRMRTPLLVTGVTFPKPSPRSLPQQLVQQLLPGRGSSGDPRRPTPTECDVAPVHAGLGLELGQELGHAVLLVQELVEPLSHGRRHGGDRRAAARGCS